MLPFTAYSFPETIPDQTASRNRWLFIITDRALSPVQTELIQKLSAAVKADFSSDVLHLNKNLDPLVSFPSLSTPELRLIISLGVLPADLELWIDINTPGIRFLEYFTFILSTPIHELEKNPAAKKELWRNMQLFMEMSEQKHA